MYSNELVCNILFFIEKNIKDKITIEDISKEFNYNRYYIMKLFKKELNISIFNYINIIKIYNSLKYFNNNHSILSCALLNGFYSQEYYNEIFKKVLGINPRTYKKIINNDYIHDKQLNIFTNNLSNIKKIINKCNEYKLNIKPKDNPIRILSIFK